MSRESIGQLTVLLAILFSGPVVQAQNEGRDDLDKATELQLQIKSLNDVARVIELCESALKKGLDDNDTKFAEELLVGSLWQRAQQYSGAILQAQRPNPQLRRFRQLALADLERLLELDDTFADGHLLNAQLQLMRREDRPDAMKSVSRAIELFGDNKQKRARALVLRARLQTEHEKQLADLSKAIETDPENADAWQLRAMYYIGRGDLEKAVQDFEKLLETDEENVGLHQAVAEALINLKKYDLALKHIEKAIEVAPESAANYLLRSRVHEQLKDLDAAVADLGEALKLDPGNAGVLLARARLQYLQNNLNQARADVDRVLAVAPESRQGLLLRAMISAGQGRLHEAIPDLERYLRADPSNLELKLQLAQFYVRDQRPRKAITVLSEVVDATRGAAEKQEDQQRRTALHVEALRARGDAFLSVGRHADAVEDYEVGLKLQPEHDGILNNLAWVLSTSPKDEVRDGKRSIELATRACQATNYEMPHILSTLAAGYAETGDFETAIKWSTKAVELGQEKLKDQIDQLKQELESYEQGKPWRELQDIKEKPDPPRRIVET